MKTRRQVNFTIFHFLAIVQAILMVPELVHATQMHTFSEGVIAHQMGHLFFLISMVILYFAIRKKALHREKGWRYIRLSALFFVLWNLDTLTVHFVDNQIPLVSPRILSIWEIQIDTSPPAPLLPLVYYVLRLDHLLCLPGMFFLWRGLTCFIHGENQ